MIFRDWGAKIIADKINSTEIREIKFMQAKDYITITISGIALLVSLVSIIITILNYKRNGTKLRITQIHFEPNVSIKINPNKLFLDRCQQPDLWEICPMLHLVIYLQIENLSYTGITISNLILNDKFLVSKLNTEDLQKDLSLTFFASKRVRDRELEQYGRSVDVSVMSLKPNDFDIININDRIEAKASVEGIIIISGSRELFNSIKDGKNKLTIITPDKQFKTYVEIDKTIIPPVSGRSNLKTSSEVKEQGGAETP